MLGRVTTILFDILAPILVMIAIGAWCQWKFKLDLPTLTKLNIYLFVPAFVFNHVAGSSLPWDKMGGIAFICLVQAATLGVIVWVIGKLLGLNQKTLAAVMLAVMFYNSGNYGLPLSELAYPGQGAAVQTFVLLTQNVLTFTVGLAIAGWAGSGDLVKGILRTLRMPVIPTLIAALVARWYCDGDKTRLPAMIRVSTEYMSGALVPFALLTLGAQLASNPRWPRWKPVGLVLILRLLFGPIQMAGILYLFHRWGWKSTDLWPFPAEILIVTAATPTAVNTLLLTMELDGDVDTAADCVFWSTVFSCVTIAIWLFVVKAWFAA